MSRSWSLGLLLVLAATIIAWSAGAASATAAPAGASVLSMNLNGVVDSFSASYVERGISAAQRNHDTAVLITIDTPGGLQGPTRQIVQAIAASKTPVICYVAPAGAQAASAGAFVMMACPISAMAPGTTIGAARTAGTAQATNESAALIGSLAERWNRNATWAQSAVRHSESLTAETALRMHVVDLVEPSQASVLGAAGACSAGGSRPSTGLLGQGAAVGGLCDGYRVVPFRMSVAESLFHGVADPDVAYLLICLGFVAAIVWVIHPGLHVSLIVAVAGLGLGLAILQTLPFEWAGVILVGLAAGLFVVDVKAHAHGILTVGGLALLVLGGLLLFNPAPPGIRVSIETLVIVPALAAFTMFWVVRALISARDEPVATGIEALVGSPGVALSSLSPTGKVRARAETWTAESVEGPVPSGRAIRVVGVEGVRLLVAPDPAIPGEPAPVPAQETRESDRS